MRDQEPLIRQYIDFWLKRLHENSDGGKKAVDMLQWYNFTTFDIIGDLAFGEPFGCLENSTYHPWVKMIFEGARVGTLLQLLNSYPSLRNVLMRLVPQSVIEISKESKKNAEKKILNRMEQGERPDLIEGLLKKQDDWNLSLDKLASNANILVIGGSETTATLLSGATYLLLTNPSALAKLTEEVRSTFSDESEITFVAASKLKYMLACLDESLRMYPPVPIGLPRVTPKSGGKILGQHIPGNTVVAVHQWASYHRAKHFQRPFEFHPERHLADAAFAGDQREMLQPFSVGPRNCIGKNLAYAEMRVILARVVFNFDMRLAEESEGWIAKQRIFFLWDKKPLKVYLTPAKR